VPHIIRILIPLKRRYFSIAVTLTFLKNEEQGKAKEHDILEYDSFKAPGDKLWAHISGVSPS
jgi:hypothetical protein